MRRDLIPAALFFLVSCSHADAAPPSVGRKGDIDEAALDRGVKPCDDFYQYACGGWMQKTSIPPDRPTWSKSFSEIQERNQLLLKKVLEEDAARSAQATGAAASGDPSDPYWRKLGDFYASCMDEDKAETASLATLKEQMARIDKIKDGQGLAQEVGELHNKGVDVLFGFGSQQDFKDATQVIGGADQGGIGLPDRDYYLKDDAKSVEIRKKYGEHVGKMFELYGDPQQSAAAKVKTVLDIETALAKVSMDRVARRDPHKIYNRLERAGLLAKAPRFAWPVYFTALDQKDILAINVAVPDFFVGLNDVLGKTKLPDLKTYLRWHALHAAAPALGKRFVEEDFRFRSSALTGEKQLLPRWKRCVEAVDRSMGEALARPFVRATFGAEGKTRSQAMIRDIEGAFGKDLTALPWMDGETRTQAQGKLQKIFNKIGYPDKWRNYDALDIDRTSYLQNLARAAIFESKRDLAKIGKPLDRSEWLMSPPTVNAYYNPSLNEMVFPAGILQPPFFNKDAGSATNYGAIGMVMGHELTHGFDDEGRQFDGAGNLREWWSKEVSAAFTQRAECVAKQYDRFTVLGDLHVNGHLTLGENIADIGGIKMAFAAWKAAGAGKPPEQKVAGLSPEQQFFVAFGQAWCTKRRDEIARMRIIVDPHSPPEYRVNGTLINTAEFQAAFSCPAGSKMAPKDRCTVW